jgi:hypothetical protein
MKKPQTNQIGFFTLLPLALVFVALRLEASPIKVESGNCDASKRAQAHVERLIENARKHSDTVSIIVWANECADETRAMASMDQLWLLGEEKKVKDGNNAVFSSPHFRVQFANPYAAVLARVPGTSKRLEEIRKYVRSFRHSNDALLQLYAVTYSVQLTVCDVDALYELALDNESVALIIANTLALAMGPEAIPRTQSILARWPRLGQNKEYRSSVERQAEVVPPPKLRFLPGPCAK